MYTGRPVMVVDGRRTPFLKVAGEPGPFRAADLATAASRTLLLAQPFEPTAFDEVIFGCVIPGPDEVNIARVIALRSGCGDQVPAWTVQRNCASGMQALDAAAMNISSGRSEMVLAGGVEAMSHAPLLWQESMVAWLARLNSARGWQQKLQAVLALRPRYLKPIIGLLRGLRDPVVGLSMGQTAEKIAQQFGIDREAMDAYAVESHRRLAAAQDEGRLQEIVPLFDQQGHVYDADTGLRRDSSMQALAKLRPVFDPVGGRVTAGNSAQITDGAAVLILASEASVKRYDLPVLGRLVDCQWSALDPASMGLGPVHAVTAMLKRRRRKLDDIDYWEINEAFSAQMLSCLAAWQDPGYCRQYLGLKTAFGTIDRERLNVDGGGIGIGHPVGATGARIVLHLLHTLQQHQAKTGIASLCIGGGQGGAMMVERV
ncbi:MAG TPA: acetyl-CoA C-acetyltransferase [Gammaproteobacteria bacterium]|nr:acetyl-CoA C-acetyltransferase [Gammaproteobacteria bacterium]